MLFAYIIFYYNFLSIKNEYITNKRIFQAGKGIMAFLACSLPENVVQILDHKKVSI